MSVQTLHAWRKKLTSTLKAEQSILKPKDSSTRIYVSITPILFEKVCGTTKKKDFVNVQMKKSRSKIRTLMINDLLSDTLQIHSPVRRSTTNGNSFWI